MIAIRAGVPLRRRRVSDPDQRVTVRTSAKWGGYPGLVALAALVPMTVAAGHLRSAPGLAKHAAPSTDTEGSVSGCHVLIKWYTYRAELDYGAAQVKVKGSPYWSRIWEEKRLVNRGFWAIPSPYGDEPPGVVTNGVIWNWPAELQQKRCDLNRRYRFKIVGLPETVTGRSNEPWVGVERWVYVPSRSSWTQKTTVDLGYLDLCLRDGTKCNGPYYPSGQTPTLSND